MSTVFKSRKVFIDYNNPMTQLGCPVFLKEPKFELYRQEVYLFGLVKKWIYRCTLFSDTKEV